MTSLQHKCPWGLPCWVTCSVNNKVPIPMWSHNLPAPMGSSPACPPGSPTTASCSSHLCSSQDFTVFSHQKSSVSERRLGIRSPGRLI